MTGKPASSRRRRLGALPFELRGFPEATAVYPGVCEDETLYSLLARYFILNGGKTYEQFLDENFATTFRRSGHDRLSLLSLDFCKAISGRSDSLIQDAPRRLTTLPYCLYFSPPEIRSCILNPHRIDHAHAFKKMIMSLWSPYPMKVPAIACVRCVEEDLAAYGYAWWRRSHQLRGVYWCHVHGEPLVAGFESCGSWIRPDRRFTLPLNDCQCGDFRPMRVAEAQSTTSLFGQRFAQVASQMLFDEAPIHEVALKSALRLQISRRYGSGRARWSLLVDELKDHADDFFLRGPTSPHSEVDRWIREACRDGSKAISLERYIILVTHLFGSLSSVRDTVQVLDAPELGKRSRKKSDATHEVAKSLELQIEVHYRQCGSALKVARDLGVSRHLVDRVTARSCPEMVLAGLKPGIKPYVPTVHELIGDGLSVNEVKRRTGLSWSSIDKIAALMPELKERGQKVLHEERRRKYRSSMIILCEKGATREQIWREMSGGTQWLFKHDHEWMASRWPRAIDILPLMKSKAGTWSEAYWTDKDEACSIRISSTVQALVDRQHGPPRRITPMMILRELGWRSYPGGGPAELVKKMPATASKIAIHSESKMAFQCRRLVRLLDEQWKEGEPLPRKVLSKSLSVRPGNLNDYLWLVGFGPEHLRTPSRIRHKCPSESEIFGD